MPGLTVPLTAGKPLGWLADPDPPTPTTTARWVLVSVLAPLGSGLVVAVEGLSCPARHFCKGVPVSLKDCAELIF